MRPPSRPSALALAGPLLGLALAGCFNSDEVRSSNDNAEESSEAETFAMYDSESEDGIDENWTAEETGPFENTCRDAIECLIMCLTQQQLNPEPEPDLSCLAECDQSLSTEEAFKLIELGECIALKCTDNGSCGPEATDMQCLTCIAGSAQDPTPPGCLEEAAACE